MILRLSRLVVCGGLVAVVGCQNPFDRGISQNDRERFETRLTIASDDVSGLETGRGHEPSLASEIADLRHEAEDAKRTRNTADTRLTIERLLERGHEADGKGQSQEAKRYYEQVLAEEPDNAEAHHRLAILGDRAGDYETAETHYLKALKTEPGNADVLNDLGYSYFLQGKPAQSERYLNKALKINPRHPHVQENLSLLYNHEKAERILRTVMGPRQTQATLAKLFPELSSGEPQQAMAQTPSEQPAMPKTVPVPPQDRASAQLDALEQKMSEARMLKLAERRQSAAPVQPPAESNRLAGLPQLPTISPTQVSVQAAPQTGMNASMENQAPDAFRPLDNGQGDLMANQNPIAMQPEMARMASANPTSFADQRPATPQWNTPPEPWPQSAPEPAHPQIIEQASYTEFPAVPPPNFSRQSLTSATQRAAEIGMAAGPGSIFPAMGEPSSASAQAPVPSTQYFPESHASLSSPLPSQPIGQATPSYGEQQPNPGVWGQQTAGWNQQAHPPEAFAAQFGSAPSPQPTNVPATEWRRDQFQQPPAAPPVQFQRDQQLSQDPSRMSAPPVAREAMPAQLHPDPQSRPIQNPPDIPRQDMPVIVPQPRMMGQSNLGGQSVPAYNATSQQPPQSYSGNW